MLKMVLSVICFILSFSISVFAANPDSVIVPGDLKILGDGNALVFPDGSMQYKAAEQGPVGPQGPTGPANTLSIGTVTTVASGSQATATITGTAPNQVLNLSIPQGPIGPQGINANLSPLAVAEVNYITKDVNISKNIQSITTTDATNPQYIVRTFNFVFLQNFFTDMPVCIENHSMPVGTLGFSGYCMVVNKTKIGIGVECMFPSALQSYYQNLLPIFSVTCFLMN